MLSNFFKLALEGQPDVALAEIYDKQNNVLAEVYDKLFSYLSENDECH